MAGFCVPIYNARITPDIKVFLSSNNYDKLGVYGWQNEGEKQQIFPPSGSGIPESPGKWRAAGGKMLFVRMDTGAHSALCF